MRNVSVAAVLIVTISTFTVSAGNVSYSTEASITPPNTENVYQVFVRVTEVTTRRGKVGNQCLSWLARCGARFSPPSLVVQLWVSTAPCKRIN